MSYRVLDAVYHTSDLLDHFEGTLPRPIELSTLPTRDSRTVKQNEAASLKCICLRKPAIIGLLLPLFNVNSRMVPHSLISVLHAFL